jgi:hypothetical protein
MKSFLKFGVALILFGLLLSVLGVGIIRAHAVKTPPSPAAVSVVDAGGTTAPATAPAKP